MKRKLSMLLVTIMIMLVAAACGTTSSNTGSGNTTGGAPTPAPEAAKAPTELTFKHLLGETKVKTNPKKVVVFDYGILDSLDKLGLDAAITAVPQSNLPPYLAKYKDAKFKNAGTLQEPAFEKINEMSPDLIIISGRQQAHYAELSKIAPTVYMGVDNKKYMETFTENMERLGQIFGKEAVVKEELGKINASVKKVKDAAAASGKNALVTLVTGGKVTAYGPGSRFGMIHDVLGITPVEKNIEVSTHGQNISFEFIVEKNPDYLFVVDRETAVGESKTTAKQIIENELVKKSNAFKNGKIIYLDPNYWYLSGGGLASVAAMVQEIEKGFK
ncbi:siderophore ABC transporter substrate-binding protein [Paenibacillus radicis (ex Xue et al. 2023)]|uniref:Siderophore ABC transporter substrate-binding protein n=1 Tax=Paenibacillus radicis (ex Xue et al. 2023) TaxID=2972489 RepID=A0ABT1YEI4_9BACL|nr:siderophore ABC transporter substrate-binding protein [Paenibacillus radicis (ex Xue et al. 2023)]MCR8631599.1 siderophore ABC transporter substrate-binding protein [Paenibacillus radicis (ex Xue et al. 2023)]